MSTEPLDPWVPDVIDIMLSEHVPLHVAAARHGLLFNEQPMTERDGAAYARRRAFKDLYERMSRAYFAAKAADSVHTKAVLTGKMLSQSEALSQAGKHKEAADVLAQVAKISGWVGPESTTTIFQDLSGADLQVLREKLAARLSAEQSKPS